MRKLSILLLLVLYSCGGGGEQSHNEWFQHPHYVERTEYLDSLDKECEVIYIGDSRVENGGWENHNATWCDFGIGGDAAFGVANRIASITDNYKVKVAIQIGYNDLSHERYSPEEVLDFLKLSYAALVASGSEVYFTSAILSQDVAINARINELNRLINAYCETNEAEFLDVNSVLAPYGLLLNTLDGVHLDSAGYSIWFHYMDGALR